MALGHAERRAHGRVAVGREREQPGPARAEAARNGGKLQKRQRDAAIGRAEAHVRLGVDQGQGRRAAQVHVEAALPQRRVARQHGPAAVAGEPRRRQRGELPHLGRIDRDDPTDLLDVGGRRRIAGDIEQLLHELPGNRLFLVGADGAPAEKQPVHNLGRGPGFEIPAHAGGRIDRLHLGVDERAMGANGHAMPAGVADGGIGHDRTARVVQRKRPGRAFEHAQPVLFAFVGIHRNQIHDNLLSQRTSAATARQASGRDSTATRTVCKKARASGVATAKKPVGTTQPVTYQKIRGHRRRNGSPEGASPLAAGGISPKRSLGYVQREFGAAAAGPGGRGRGRPTVPSTEGDPLCACTGRRDESRGLALFRKRRT